MGAARILIVEDERIIAEDLKQSLEKLGYEVIAVVASGEKAVEVAAAETPDLVFMDIILRGAMDGIQAASEIRRRQKLPVIFLTAYADAATLERAKVTEPNGYLIKPFEDRALSTAVEIALHRHKMERKLRENEE